MADRGTRAGHRSARQTPQGAHCAPAASGGGSKVLGEMTGLPQSERDASSRRRRGRWRAASEAPWSPRDQEDEVRERLYAKPPVNERTVELLGPVTRIAQRPAA